MAPIGHLLLRSHRRCLGFFFGQTSCGARQRSGSSENEVLGPSRLAKICQNEFVELFWFFEPKKMPKKVPSKSPFDRNKKPRPNNQPPFFPPPKKKKKRPSFFRGAPKGNLGFRKWTSFPPFPFPMGFWKTPPEPSLAASLAPSAKWYPAP